MEKQRKNKGKPKGTQLIVSEFWVVLLSGVCAQGLSELRIGKSMTRCHTDCPALRSGEWPQLLIPFPACSHEIAIAEDERSASLLKPQGRQLSRERGAKGCHTSSPRRFPPTMHEEDFSTRNVATSAGDNHPEQETS